MSPPPIGIGIIGTGFGALVQLPGFAGVDGARVVGIAGRNAPQAEALARKSGIRAFATVEALIGAPEVEAVAIAVPAPVQPEIARRCIAAGKSLLCEKPLAPNASEARALLALAQHAGIVHGVDFEYRELAAFRAAFALLQTTGNVRHVQVRWRASTWADPQRPWSWKCDAAAGGGVLTALVVHVLDYLPWLVQRQICSVSAAMSCDIPLRRGEHGMVAATAETTCTARLTFEGGMTANIEVTNTAHDNLGHEVVLKTDTRTLRIHSENREDYARGFSLSEGHDVLQSPMDPPAGEDGRIVLFRSLAARFVDAIRTGNRAGLPDFADGSRAQAALDGLRLANIHGREVDIPSVEN